MNINAKNLWCKALRSGEFRQGFKSLYCKETNSYCIMGVLAEIAMINGVCDYEERTNHYNKATFGLYDGQSTVLPLSVVKWAELENRSGAINGEFMTLQGYNDLGQYDFEQLADIIEENWEKM